MLYRFLFLVYLAGILSGALSGQSCSGLKADAGPDQFTCDPTKPIQLMGSFNGTPMKYYWTPTSFLSDPNITDPIVNAPPGKYKYTFHVEAISNTNLIVNGNFEAGNTGFTYDYNYGTPGGTFSPGWLSVGTNPKAYNSFFSACGDHTTGSGNMLIVDGSTVPNSNLWCQNVNVTPGKMYLFRFYLQSVFAPSPCHVIVLANGTQIGSITGGTTCDWQTFEVCFTPTATPVKMCLQETSLIAFGNDFAVDDIEMYEKCMDQDDVEIEVVDLKAQLQVPKPPKCASDIFDLNGNGSSTGANVQYQWRTEGGTIISENGLTAKGKGSGKYFLKVIFNDGNVICEKEVEVDIKASEDVLANLNVEGIANCNLDTIILKAKALTGSGNYSYQWIPGNKILRGQNESTAYVTDAGIYKVIIRDLNSGCETEVQDVVVSDTVKPKVQISGDTLISCNQKFITFKSTPFDTTKFIYSWLLPDSSKLINQDSLISKIAGNYSLVVIDKNNKCITTQSRNVFVDSLKPNIDLGPDLVINCINNEVDIIPIENNPNTSINYYWSLPSGVLPFETSLNTKKENKAGIVILRLVNNVNGCSQSDTVIIKDVRNIPYVNVKTADTLNCKIKDFQLDASKTPLDSSLFFWSTINGNILSGNNTLTPRIDAPGWYLIHIEDTINHCKNEDSVLVIQNIIYPDAVLGPDLLFSCHDSLLTLDGSHSTQAPQIKYFWQTPDGNINQGQGTNTVRILSPGLYYLILQDSINFCSDTASIHVNADLNAPMASITVNDTLTCNKTSIVLNGSASSPNSDSLSYIWSGVSGQIIQNSSGLNPTVTQAGDYILTVIDLINGCRALANASVNIDTIKPKADAGINENWYCNTKLLKLDGTASSGNHTLGYEWTTVNGNIISNPNLDTINVAAPGLYNLKVIDLINGCESRSSVNAIADLTIPNALIQNPDTLDCARLNVLLNGQGSSAGNRIEYLWSSTDGNIIGATNQKNATVNKPGHYLLFVLDTVNHCSETDSVIVVQDITPPVADAGNPVDMLCQELTKIISGIDLNPMNHQYHWSTQTGNIIGRKDSIQLLIGQPGWYYFQVTNSLNACSATDSVLVSRSNNLIVDAGPNVVLTCQQVDTLISVQLQNGAGNELFSWLTYQGNIIGGGFTSQIRVNKAGWYYVTIGNAVTGCSGMDSVFVDKITKLNVDAGPTDELTCKHNIAQLTGTIESAIGNEFTWKTQQGHFVGSPSLPIVNVDQPGWYYLVVDNLVSGCSGIDSVFITKNNNLPKSVNLTIDQPNCPGDRWETEITNITGGEKPLQIFLNNQLINGLTMSGANGGDYIIRIIDHNACELLDTFHIISPAGVSVQLTPLVKLNQGDNYNLLPVYSIPDDSIVSVKWEPTEFLSCSDCPYPMIIGITHDREYTVTYSNHKGCKASASIQIEIIKRNIWIPNVFSPNGDNINDSFYPVVTENSYREIRSMQIFDRWGNRVYVSEHFPPNDPAFGWNGDFKGAHMNPGVFVFIIEVEWKNGDLEMKHGDVTLMR